MGLVFDPFELELGITPQTVKETLVKREHAKGLYYHSFLLKNKSFLMTASVYYRFITALMMALKLNERLLIQEVVENIPYGDSEYQ